MVAVKHSIIVVSRLPAVVPAPSLDVQVGCSGFSERFISQNVQRALVNVVGKQQVFNF